MILKRKELLRQYRISYHAFFCMVTKLPASVQDALKVTPNRPYLNNQQLIVIREHFGDWTTHSFKSKQELCLLYGVSRPTFRKMLKEAFGVEHPIYKDENKKVFTAKEVALIESELGEP
jgi:hypothetical protein